MHGWDVGESRGAGGRLTFACWADLNVLIWLPSNDLRR